MKLLTPNLSMATGARVVVNSLYDSKEPGFLTQDLMLIELPNKTYIDVSWFPEHDPLGAYSVTVFRSHKQIIESEAKTAYEAVNIVERLAADFSSPLGNVTNSVAQTFHFQPAA
ncbi:MAG: hypothetical protein ACLQGP_34135 [Isosphaeraceae bacterium]